MKYLFVFAIRMFARAFVNARTGDDIENAADKIKDKITGSTSSFALNGFLATTARKPIHIEGT